MKRTLRKLLLILTVLCCALGLFGCAADAPETASGYTAAQTGPLSGTEKADAVKTAKESEETENAQIDKDGEYTSKEDVALYIYTYGELPGNFITKKEAKALGWEGGALEPYAPGKSIGGDYFGNYEGLLPEKEGRTYQECDIDTKGKKRGAKRIIYSDDGLIYYTDDHYESFTLLYGTE